MPSTMRTRLLAALAAVATVAGVASGVSTPALDASVRTVDGALATHTWPVHDAHGRHLGTTKWRVSEIVGNCCEVYATALPDGGLAEFGGAEPLLTRDRGQTWTRASAMLTQLGGEGTIAAAPGGDVVGVSWDPYTGERIVGFKYVAATGKWQYTETFLHEPMWDRPWITVVPGPFTVGGREVPYVTIITSNYQGQFHDVFYLSTDGLTYTAPAVDYVDALVAPPLSQWLEPRSTPALDWAQPHLRAKFVPLPGGRAANVRRELGSCPVTVMEPDLRFRCYALPDGDRLQPTTRVDSRGALHQLVRDRGGMTYQLSRNGGRTWHEVVLDAPGGGVWDFNLTDMKVNGALGLAAIVTRLDQDGLYQDVVFKIDTRSARPRLLDVRLLGRGDAAAGAGVSELGTRVDFSSVSIMRDGTLAASFHDSGHDEVALAIEVPGSFRHRGR